MGPEQTRPERAHDSSRETPVQLVMQWVDTKAGGPCMVFWDTGFQVTLTTHKAAQAMRLQAILGSPLNLTGISGDHQSRLMVRYKVPLIDTEGRTVLVTAYGIEHIMAPMEEGDPAPMRAAFPEVPANGGLVIASGKVGLLVGQDKLSLFFPLSRTTLSRCIDTPWLKRRGWPSKGGQSNSTQSSTRP